MLYLASPYSHPDPLMKEQRALEAAKATAKLIYANVLTFSPIAHSHPMHLFGLDGDWKYWEKLDTWFIERCNAVVVLTIAGWDRSQGIAAEVRLAGKLGKSVWFWSGNAADDPVFNFIVATFKEKT